MTLEELSRFRAGDHGLFRALVDAHSPRLLALCRGFARDDDGAHDLLQETWLRVYAKRRQYRGGSFVAWIVTICRRICLSSVRTRTAATSARRSPVDPERLPESHEAGGADPAERAELRAHVTRALFDLPERQCAAVVHRVLEGLSTRETAVAMGCAEGTVKATLHQALSRLAPPLRPHLDDDVARHDAGATIDSGVAR